MPGPTQGRGAGVSGLLDLPGYGAKFEVRCRRYKQRMNGAQRERRGRGGGRYSSVRWTFSSGTLTATGHTTTDGWPAPDKWEGQRGTIRVQVDVGKYITYSVEVLEMGFDFDEEKQDRPFVVFALRVIDSPTYAGWKGTQPAATSPTKSNQIQWDESSKTDETGNLGKQATRLTDIWGDFADNDAAENALLADIIAAAQPPLPGLKLNTALFRRDAKDGGTVLETWQQTTSDERVINEASSTTLDPEHIVSQANVANFNSAPGAPTGDGFVLFSSGTKEYNDSMLLYTADYRLLTSAQAIEFPSTSITVDLADLTSFGKQLTTFKHGQQVPSSVDQTSKGVQVVNSTILRINGVMDQVLYEYGKDTSKQKWEQEHSFTYLDDSAIESKAESAAIDDDTPTTISGGGLLKIGQRTENVTHDHAGYVDQYDTKTTKQAREFKYTKTSTDPFAIDSASSTGEVYANSGSPAASSPPAAHQLVNSYIVPETNAKSIQVYEYAKLTSRDKLVLPETWQRTDSFSLDSEARRAYMDGEGDPGNPDATKLQIVATDVKQITHPSYGNRTLTLKDYANLTTRDKLVLPHSFTVTEVGGIGSRGETSYLDGETPPTLTADANGKALVARDAEVKQITHPSYGNRQQTVTKYGRTTPQQDIEQGHTRAVAAQATKYRRQIASIISSSASVADIADSLLAANQSDATFIDAIVSRDGLPSDQALQILRYDATDKLMHGQSNHVVREQVRGLPSSGLVGATFIPGAIDPTNMSATILINFNFGALLAKPLFIWRALGRFLFRRVYSTDNMPSLQYLAVRGMCNNAPFLGYSTGEVIYAGPAAAYLFNISGARRLVIEYEFLTDQCKFFNDGILPSGSTAVNSGSILSSGLYSSSQFEAGYGVTFPGTADFSGFRS